ncbi:MAG: tyrosine--tRNA ligase [Dehalococcoidia bacterium]
MAHFQNVFEELKWRGVVFDSTPGAAEVLASEKVTCYAGFDPTAKSLHIGNLVPIMGLVRMQRHGHSPIAIVGGGTGMIGDPSGRSEERQLLTPLHIEENVAGIRGQLERFLDFDSKSNRARLINNADWLLKTRLIEFLRDIGKHFTVNQMLGRESVRSRIDRDSGISYTEFSYMLLQAYDFLKLYEDHGCTFQMGGSDQWGNILGGVDLIRRVHGTLPQGDGPGANRAHGIVYPLITTAAGEKFGKSVGGAPTLDPNETSPYRLYQFFLNAADQDVVKYLKLFTLLEPPAIAEMEEAVRAEPKKREAQNRLAEEVTRMIHGTDGLDKARRVTHSLFGDDISALSASELEDVFADAPGGQVSRTGLEDGLTVQSLVVGQQVCKSGGEVRRLLAQGGLYLNGERIQDPQRRVTVDDFIDGQLLVLRRGAKNYHLVRLVE